MYSTVRADLQTEVPPNCFAVSCFPEPCVSHTDRCIRSCVEQTAQSALEKLRSCHPKWGVCLIDIQAGLAWQAGGARPACGELSACKSSFGLCSSTALQICRPHCGVTRRVVTVFPPSSPSHWRSASTDLNWGGPSPQFPPSSRAVWTPPTRQKSRSGAVAGHEPLWIAHRRAFITSKISQIPHKLAHSD